MKARRTAISHYEKPVAPCRSPPNRCRLPASAPPDTSQVMMEMLSPVFSWQRQGQGSLSSADKWHAEALFAEKKYIQLSQNFVSAFKVTFSSLLLLDKHDVSVKIIILWSSKCKLTQEDIIFTVHFGCSNL